GYGGGAEAQREAEIEEELARRASLESEIEADLRRREELLREIDSEEPPARTGTPGVSPPAPSADQVAERADPRPPPRAPRPRELPESIFEERKQEIPAGKWGNTVKLKVRARSLDADRDGKSEEVRYFDQKTGAL